MDVKISKAKNKDSSYIQEKLKKYLLDSSNADWRHFFVARIKNKTVAFGRIIDHGEFHEIASLGVDYYYRKKGVGKKMLSFLVREARKRNVHKPIYGVTHLPQFVTTCGFIQVQDDYPDYLDYKRKHICQLHESKISIVKWSDSLA